MGAETKHQLAPPSKEANKYIRKLKEHLLQPSRKHYSGMGYAKESVFLQLDDPDYDAKFGHIWEEHVPGFSGKSFKKRKNTSEHSMLWKQRLKTKQASIQQQIGQAQVSTPTSRGKTQPLKRADRMHSGQHPTGQHSTPRTVDPAGQLLKPHKSKKKASPQQDQAARLQGEAIAAYRQLKKARRMQT